MTTDNIERRVSQLERDKESKGSVGCLAAVLMVLILFVWSFMQWVAAPNRRTDGMHEYLCWNLQVRQLQACVVVDHIVRR